MVQSSWYVKLIITDTHRGTLCQQRLFSQTCGFSSSHVLMWELDNKEGWTLKKLCFYTVVLEKTVESPLGWKEIKPVNPKGNQSWIFLEVLIINLKLQYFGHLMWRTDSLEKTLILAKIQGRRRRRRRQQRVRSVRFSLSVMSDSLWPHGLQNTRLPSPLPAPGAYSNSCPSSQWCHPTISSFVIPFFSHLQSFPALGSFQMSQFFASVGQSIGVSASPSVLSMNVQDWFPLGWTGWISLQSKGLSRVFSNTTVKKCQFFGAQLSLESNFHIYTWLLEKVWLWLDGPFLAK